MGKSFLLAGLSAVAFAAASGPAQAQLEEIMVVARKKAESIQEVPISITALNGEALQGLGVEDISDVARFAPNVSFDGTAAVSGSSIASTVFIRGVGQTDFTLNSDPGVGIYIDGVYVARSVGGLLDLVDVASVEVLRGPQGTLFGKNTIGGAINISSRRPDPDAGGYIQFEGGNFARTNVRAGFDLGITDTLAVNVSGAFLNQDGYQQRILTPDEPELGDINRYVMRGRALWTPTEAFEADLILDYTRGREQSVAQSLLEIEPNTGAPFLPAAAGLIPGTTLALRPGFEGQFTGEDLLSGAFITDDPRETFYTGPSRSDFDIFGISLTMTYDFGPVQVKSITAYREVLSDFARNFFSAPFIGDTVDRYDQNQFSQEVQVLGELWDGRVDYVAGVFYLGEEGTNDNLVDTPIGDLGSGGSVDNDSLAFFAQANTDITDQLKLTAGIRYTDEKKRFDPGFRGGEQTFFSDANGLGLGLPPEVPLIVAPETLGLGEFYVNSDDKVDFTVNLGYSITSDILAYVSYSTGFKAGGFSQRIGPGPGVSAPQFRREDVSTVEAGFKSTLFDQSLRLNGAVFYSDYEDLQVTPIFEGIGPVTRNIGDAEIWGFELEFNYVPNDVFEWSGGIGYLQNELTSITPEAAVNLELDGSQLLTLDTQLPKTPKWSLNSAVSYRIPIDTQFDVVLRANWSFTSRMFNDVLNSPILERESLHLVGANVSVEKDDWVLSFTGNNLTDEEYIIAGNDETAQGQFGYTQGTFARPREWWFTIRRNF